MANHFVVMHRDNPEAWALMPFAMERVKRFCKKYRTDTDPEELAKLLRLNFVADDPLLLAIVVYKQGEGVFCHALAGIEEITGTRFLVIMQYETDLPFTENERDELMNMYRYFEEWGRQHGAGAVNLVTNDEAHVRLFERFFGYKKHRIVMRKSLLGE